jgi:hypothetical protein
MAFPKIILNPLSMAVWQASFAYALNVMILDSAFHVQQVTTAGTSGTTTPAFNHAGGTTTDGTAVWTDLGNGQTITLQLQYPPRKVPYRDYESVLHANIASSGVQENIFERLDIFTGFDMEFVVGSDKIAAWDTFISSAIQGFYFRYYADASQPSYTNYFLVGNTWIAAYKSPSVWSFSCRFRQRAPWPS